MLAVSVTTFIFLRLSTVRVVGLSTKPFTAMVPLAAAAALVVVAAAVVLVAATAVVSVAAAVVWVGAAVVVVVAGCRRQRQRPSGRR